MSVGVPQQPNRFDVAISDFVHTPICSTGGAARRLRSEYREYERIGTRRGFREVIDIEHISSLMLFFDLKRFDGHIEPALAFTQGAARFPV